MKLPLSTIFLLLLIPITVGTIASIAMARVFGTSFEDGGTGAAHATSPALPAGGKLNAKA